MPRKKKKPQGKNEKSLTVHLLDKTITKLLEAKSQPTKNAHCVAPDVEE